MERNWLQGLWETGCQILFLRAADSSPLGAPASGSSQGDWSLCSLLQPASIPGYWALRHALRSSHQHEACCVPVCIITLLLSLNQIALATHSQP